MKIVKQVIQAKFRPPVYVREEPQELIDTTSPEILKAVKKELLKRKSK